MGWCGRGELTVPSRAENQAVFLDRDGVIIANRDDYVKRWEEVHFLAGSLEALRELAKTKFSIVLITNQSAVGRGLLTLDEADTINKRLSQRVQREGGRIDGCYMCPHAPWSACECRKPKPGLLLKAIADLRLDAGSSYFIGDAVSDIEAALSAGVRPLMVSTGRGSKEAVKFRTRPTLNCVTVQDLRAAVGIIKEMSK
jgi:D-glycero-D-manno-heptose 1,7-bisphosphate phosphatase